MEARRLSWVDESRLRWALLRGERPPAGTAWLGRWEAERAASLRFEPRRHDFLLGRWACKRALSEALGVAPGPRLEVRALPWGAPRAFLDGAPAPVSISLSHRAGAALCALGPADLAVGADLELIEPRSRAFVETYFTPAEIALCRGDAALLPNLIWSAKESALKSLGDGLRRDTREVEIQPALQGPIDGWLGLRARVAGQTLRGAWRREGALVLTLIAGARRR